MVVVQLYQRAGNMLGPTRAAEVVAVVVRFIALRVSSFFWKGTTPIVRQS